jgi:hypothetical protein
MKYENETQMWLGIKFDRKKWTLYRGTLSRAHLVGNDRIGIQGIADI